MADAYGSSYYIPKIGMGDAYGSSYYIPKCTFSTQPTIFRWCSIKDVQRSHDNLKLFNL